MMGDEINWNLNSYHTCPDLGPDSRHTNKLLQKAGESPLAVGQI